MPYFFSGFFQPRMQNGQLGSSQTAAQQKMFGTRAILSPWVAITRKLPKNLSIERRTTSRMFSQTQQRRAYLGVHQGAEVKTTTLRRGVYIKRVFSSKKDAPPELPKEPPKPTKGNPKNPTKTSTITTEKSSTSAAPLEAEADTVASTTTGLTPNALKASVESAVAEFQLNASRLSTERKRNILALSFATLTITSVFFGKKIYDSGKESVAEITGEVISHEHMQIKTSELAAAVVKHVLNDENVMKKAERPKKAVDLSMIQHKAIIQYAATDYWDAVDIINKLQDDINFRVKIYAKCMAKTTDNYRTWLQDEYTRRLKTELRHEFNSVLSEETRAKN